MSSLFHRSQPCVQFLLLAALVAALPLSGLGEDADAVFGRGNWREALRLYQIQLDQQWLQQKLTSKNSDAIPSGLIETESAALLKAHCLFERGTLAFGKKDAASALRDWNDCRNALASIPKVGLPYLRRANLALAQLWLPVAATKDLRFFDEGLTQICKTIDDAPLPEDSADYRCQLRGELQFLLARTVLSTIQALYVNQNDDARRSAIMIQNLTEFWSRQSLFMLLADESASTGTLHEALVDQSLFRDAGPNCQEVSFGQLLKALNALPTPIYSEAVAVMCVYALQTKKDDAIASLLNTNIDPRRLDKARFGSVIYRVLQAAADFPNVDRPGLLRGLCKRLDLISWTQPEVRIDVAAMIAKSGDGNDALRLLPGSKEVSGGSALYPRFCVALAQSLYTAGRYEESIAVGTTPGKGSAGSFPAGLLYWRALSYAKLRKPDNAIGCLQEFLKRVPEAVEAPESCFFLATLYLSSGRNSEAHRYFAQTAALYAGTPWAERAQKLDGVFN